MRLYVFYGGWRRRKEWRNRIEMRQWRAVMEYFGRAIVQVYWIGLKIKKLKNGGYADFLENEKMRKKCEKNILKLQVDFYSFLYIL